VKLAQEGARFRYPGRRAGRVTTTCSATMLETIAATPSTAPYFLTVHDIVRFARQKGILCRGVARRPTPAVCYCLGITEVDPSHANLLFERFISPNRDEPPDIDVDFEHERREDVMQYIYGK